MTRSDFMKRRLRDLLAVALAVLLSAGIIGLLTVFSNVDPEEPERVIIRDVEVGLPPPPPPPPKRAQRTETTASQLSINQIGNQSGPKVQFSERPTLANVKVEQIEQPEMDRNMMELDTEMSGNSRSFRVEKLDEVPQIVSSRDSRIPRELIQEGIRVVEAKVDIIIDTRGEAYIKRIVDAGYPQMVPVIRKHVDAVKFTIPKKDGNPVNGEYYFTIRFREL
ncbi:hypothetical protein [Marinimicrobium agarilyticum]|uniref:hypothetical protein n=1 Tax=Marinimicrobium agarilyticum TaxID=306546 RepID=UPI000684686B|nr:hypothetical protein [Marinimicrobium agarilyticum]